VSVAKSECLNWCAGVEFARVGVLLDSLAGCCCCSWLLLAISCLCSVVVVVVVVVVVKNLVMNYNQLISFHS
jgi:hypothetical protein